MPGDVSIEISEHRGQPNRIRWKWFHGEVVYGDVIFFPADMPIQESIVAVWEQIALTQDLVINNPPAER